MISSNTNINNIINKHHDLLEHQCTTITKNNIYIPNNNFINDITLQSDRNTAVLCSLSQLFKHGRLANTGYINILPVDQGIEHSAGASFAKNIDYFNPKNIVELAIEGGCNAITSSFGILGSIARKYAHKIPFILKINHNELLSFPNIFKQTLFTSTKKAFEMGCIGIGATIYWGSHESRQQIKEISEAFATAHDLGMFTILWCYVRNKNFIKNTINYNASADLTGQANYLGCNIQADFIKQKLPINNYGYKSINFGKTSQLVYDKLSSNHPIDLCRYQVANCYMGRIGLINSGGPSHNNDLEDIITSTIINKRAGGMGMIAGRKIFQTSKQKGIHMLNAIQDIYLNKNITIA